MTLLGSPADGITSELSQVGVRMQGPTLLSRAVRASMGRRCGPLCAGAPCGGLTAEGFLPAASQQPRNKPFIPE